jgi:hypothetical protein
MLKEYFDRDSTISKLISVVNSVPQNQCSVESNSYKNFEKSDPGSAKLENSDILKKFG